MQDESEKWLKVLGLAPGASEQAIKDAYRDLVKVWHPDRFATDARLQQKAQEKLTELNTAFEHLQSYRPRDPRPSTSSDVPPGAGDVPPPWMYGRMTTMVIVSAAIGAVGVWLLVSGRRTIDQPSGSAGPFEPPRAQDNRVSATRERRQPAPREPATVALPSAEPRPESPAAATTGSLRVESQPTGARVSFDGETIGETPLIVTDVAPGEHQIGLDLDAQGYKHWSSSVVVAAGQEEKLLAVMTPGAGRR